MSAPRGFANTSSFPRKGLSFNRTGANFAAGARTPLAAVFSAFALLLILVFVKPLAAFIPIASMAAVLFIVAWGLIDFAMIRSLLRTSRGEALTLAVTFIATLSIRLEVAILIGVLVSLLVYLNRTTHPRLTRVLPDPAAGRRFDPVAVDAPLCPQVDILRVDGSLFFGAVEHVRDELEAARAERPDIRHLLLVASAINFVDASGAELLVQPQVRDVLKRGGQLDAIGRENVFDTKDEAIRSIYARLDVPTCSRCKARVFNECQHLLPDGTPREQQRPDFALASHGSGPK